MYLSVLCIFAITEKKKNKTGDLLEACCVRNMTYLLQSCQQEIKILFFFHRATNFLKFKRGLWKCKHFRDQYKNNNYLVRFFLSCKNCFQKMWSQVLRTYKVSDDKNLRQEHFIHGKVCSKPDRTWTLLQQSVQN